jgi:L-fuculose-phosphate aldolase
MYNSTSEQNIKRAIINACKRLHQKNMLASADGNVSFRIDDSHILITPSGLSKAHIEESDFAVIDLNGNIINGNPSGERLMHLAIYKQCPMAKAVVHAHPPHAIAWTIAFPELTELPATSLSEVILACGQIPIVPYARPSTAQMGDNLKCFLPKSRLMILARHGAVAWGESLDEATNGMERLEHSAQILTIAKNLGQITNLPDDEVQFLKQMRTKLGDKIL